jgi:hypothetical protein
MQERHEEILAGFRNVLEQMGVHGVDVKQFGLAPFELRSGKCPPGETLKLICEEQPDGSIECVWKCVTT